MSFIQKIVEGYKAKKQRLKKAKIVKETDKHIERVLQTKILTACLVKATDDAEKVQYFLSDVPLCNLRESLVEGKDVGCKCIQLTGGNMGQVYNLQKANNGSDDSDKKKEYFYLSKDKKSVGFVFGRYKNLEAEMSILNRTDIDVVYGKYWKLSQIFTLAKNDNRMDKSVYYANYFIKANNKPMVESLFRLEKNLNEFMGEANEIGIRKS